MLLFSKDLRMCSVLINNALWTFYALNWKTVCFLWKNIFILHWKNVNLVDTTSMDIEIIKNNYFISHSNPPTAEAP